jgi:hypothetical protein
MASTVQNNRQFRRVCAKARTRSPHADSESQSVPSNWFFLCWIGHLAWNRVFYTFLPFKLQKVMEFGIDYLKFWIPIVRLSGSVHLSVRVLRSRSQIQRNLNYWVRYSTPHLRWIRTGIKTVQSIQCSFKFYPAPSKLDCASLDAPEGLQLGSRNRIFNPLSY